MNHRYLSTVLSSIPAFLVLSVFLVLAYSNTYDVPFIFDDSHNIVTNPFVKLDDFSWKSVKQLASLSPSPWRWLPNISFGLNYYWGGLDVFGFHLVNISIHALTAFFFYLLAKITLELPGMAGRFSRTKEIALVAALLWAVHPVQTNAVTYIVQRMTSMATMFSLCSLLCYARARLAAASHTKIILFAASILTGFMALFSKENSGMLPLMILAYEFFFLRQAHAIKRKKLLLLAAASTLIFILICALFLGSNPVESILAGYGSRDFTLGQRLLTQTRIIFHYLSLLVLPLPSRLNLAYDFQLSTGLLAPAQTLLALTGLAGLTFLGFSLYRHARLASFAIFWFLGNLLVESSVIPLELIFEHRMYMPVMFVILAAASWAYRLGAQHVNRARLPLVIIVIIFCLFTWQRNSVWKNEISIWTDVVNKTPDSMRANRNLGTAYSNAQKYIEAEKYLRIAIYIGENDKSPNYSSNYMRQNLASAHHNLGLVYRNLHNTPRALEETLRSVELDPSRPEPLVTLGISSFQLGKVDEAISLLQFALGLDPDHAESHYNLGIAYGSKGMLKEAQREMTRAMQLKNKN
jgi:tetratricopeptide (TPR) repeat protein